jgi:hypothetical protein
LQELELEGCSVIDSTAAFAAIAALPELRNLFIAGIEASELPEVCIFGDLELLTQLTRLRIDAHNLEQQQQLGQLSVLTGLQELGMNMPSSGGVPGGLPSQLQKLTCLHVSYSLPF